MRSSTSANREMVQCLVVGAGPAGMAAAIALAKAGSEVALAGLVVPGETGRNETTVNERGSTPADTRTAALFPGSIQLLEQLGAGPSSGLECAPLLGIRLVDQTGGLLRAPEILFQPAEIGEASFGCNVSQPEIARALRDAVEAHGVRVLGGGHLARLDTSASGVGATLADGTTIDAQLIVAADGRNSLCRAAAGITVRRWSYAQTAVATRFSHQRPHHGISTELHRPAGPCTTVPLKGQASSLVWVETPEEADRLCKASETEFIARLEALFGGLLGTISNLGARRAFPLEGLRTSVLAGNRVVLIGEAGHVIPPIGAQGLNLGLLDVAVLADCVEDRIRSGGDLGGAAVLDAYAARRSGDIDRRSTAVDLMNRSLTAGLLPLSLARGMGLHAIAAVPALRRRVMREGLGPTTDIPRLMQRQS